MEEYLADIEKIKKAQIFAGRRKPLTRADAMSMMVALKHPALVYVLPSGECLIQGNCDRLSTNFGYFMKYDGPVPTDEDVEEILLEPTVATD